MLMKEQWQFWDRPTQTVRLLRTKLLVPQPHPDFVPRARLLEQLDRGQSGRLTIVCAAAGFGKTTLLSHWIRERGIVAAWVSLDASDNDPVRFWTYVVSALASAKRELGEATLTLLRLPQSAPIATVLGELINDIATVSENLTLVLDDYHVIETSAIHKALSFLLDNLPPQLRLVIASRHDPPLPLARFRAQRQLLELRERDLSFTEEETAAFLNRVMGLRLPAQDVSALQARTEGWAVGLQLAALSMQTEKDFTSSIRTFTGSHRHVFDYLAQEVLRHQPGHLKAFLLRASVLDRLCGSLCEAVTEMSDSQAMLERLEMANLFTVPLDQERSWYRFHHLFADFLRSRARNEFGEHGVADLHRRASDWYARQGFIEDAVAHALAAAEYEIAARLIEEHAPSIFARGEVSILVAWSRSFPARLLRSSLKLSVIFAWAQLAMGNRGQAEKSTLVVEQAVGGKIEMLADEEAYSLPPEARAALVEVSVIRGATAVSSFDTRHALHLVHLALPFLTDDAQPYLYNKPVQLRPAALFIMAIAHELAGDVNDASAAFAEAAKLSYHQGNLHILPMALAHLAQLRIVQGQLRLAVETYHQGIELAKQISSHLSPYASAAYVGLGNLMYERNDLDAATTNLEEGIAMARKWNYWDALIPGFIGLARVRAARADWGGAFSTLDEAAELFQVAGLNATIPALDALRARLFLQMGDLETAARWAESSGLGLEGEITYLREAESITLARILVAQRRYDEAEELLTRLMREVEDKHRTGRLIEILAVRATALHARGQTAVAIAEMKRALEIAEPEGFVRVFLDEGAGMADLLRRTRLAGIARPYVDSLLYAFHCEEERGEVSGEQPNPRPAVLSLRGASCLLTPAQLALEPLSDREIGVLRLIADGLTNDEIADRLVISVNTVKTHVKNIYSKLGARSRTQAIAAARALRIL